MADDLPKSTSFVIFGLLFLGIGGTFLYKLYIQPAAGHSEVSAIRVIDTAKGPMLLSSEDVGRGNSKVVARRTTLIDPGTLQNIARAFDSDADLYLGQAKSGGALWFAPRGKFADKSRFVARDPLTLDRLFTSDDLLKKYPGQLGMGLHEYRFDSTNEAIWVLANDGQGYLVKGSSYELVSASTPASRPSQSAPSTPEKLAPSVSLLKPAWLSIRDGKSGDLIALTDPPGALISSRTSLTEDASIMVDRLDAEGRLLWKTPLTGQRKIVKCYRLDNRLLVISAGENRAGNDWLTALDAARGTPVAQYQF